MVFSLELIFVAPNRITSARLRQGLITFPLMPPTERFRR